MDWLLQSVLRGAAELDSAPLEGLPPAVERALEDFLEDAGIALASTGAGFDTLDALGEEADWLAARALALLN